MSLRQLYFGHKIYQLSGLIFTTVHRARIDQISIQSLRIKRLAEEWRPWGSRLDAVMTRSRPASWYGDDDCYATAAVPVITYA